MAYALQGVAWETSFLEPVRDRELEAYWRARMGVPNIALGYYSAVPWLARAMVDLHPECGLLVHLDPHLADLVTLVVSQENSCRFCFAAVRMMLWGLGMDQARIERIEQEVMSGALPPRTVAAIAFGRSQSRNGPPGAPAARAALEAAGFSAPELRELAFVSGITDHSNRVHSILAIPVEPMERLPQRWYMKLMRPVIRRVISKHRSAGVARPFEGDVSFPLGRIVTAFGDSPIAPVLGHTLRQMWASPLLTRRCKLLLFAVVSHGLGCTGSADELRQQLVAEGMPVDHIDQAIRHLDAPSLDAIERLVVPFARETIWYEPSPLQRRARLLREQLSAPQLLETVGVLALANALCRMNAMVCAPSPSTPQ